MAYSYFLIVWNHACPLPCCFLNISLFGFIATMIKLSTWPLGFRPSRGKTDQFHRGIELQLSFDIRTMNIHGFNTQKEFFSDVAGTFALADELEDLKFAVGQFFHRGVFGGGATAG